MGGFVCVCVVFGLADEVGEAEVVGFGGWHGGWLLSSLMTSE